MGIEKKKEKHNDKGDRDRQKERMMKEIEIDRKR